MNDRAERHTKTLKCVLSDEEVAKRADHMANLIGTIKSKEEQAKAAQKQAKSEIDRDISTLNLLSDQVASHSEYRMVECERRFDRNECRVVETRLDTNEIIEIRKMTEAERQLTIEMDEEDAQDDEKDWPISELGTKRFKAIVGDEVFASCNGRGQPIGLSDKVLEKIEAAEVETIRGLEQRMRDNRDWWRMVAQSQDAAVVTRICDSLAEFRRAYPVGEKIA